MHVELFGEYLRRKRVEAKLSLRALAHHLGISFTYLGEVERGECGALDRGYWPLIVDAIPGTTLRELERVSANSRHVTVDLASVSDNTRAAAMTFARRIVDGTVDDELASKLLALLSESQK